MTPTSIADRSAAVSSAPESLETRIVDAMLECIGRWGLAKTTADDIARCAGVSRATLYRAFPGGKDVALDALLSRETARFFDVVTGPLEGVTTLEDTLVVGIVEAARFIQAHGPLQYLLTHEPERVLPTATFHGLSSAFAIATTFTTPHLRPFVADDAAAVAGAEWVVRQFFSYTLVPSPSLDLTDEAGVRRFVRSYVLPALTTSDQRPPKEI
jgi:AcrR family transcriptional regulator